MAALSSATTYQVVQSALIHLNDEMGLNWPDNRILPKFQEAHRELRNELILNGIPVIHEVSAVLSVPANTTDLTTIAAYPTNIIIPIWMKERQVGQTDRDFTDMQQMSFIPNEQQQTTLNYWSWIGEKIKLLGATIATEVQLRYQKEITAPVEVNETVGAYLAETFLSYRTAALCAASIKDYEQSEYLGAIAQKNLDTVIGINVKGLQNLPVRRIPYHRRYGSGRSWWW